MLFSNRIVLFMAYVTGQFLVADCRKYDIEFGSYANVDMLADMLADVMVVNKVPGVSFDACKKLCSRRYDCWTLNYHMKAHICYNLLDYLAYTPVYDVQRRPNFVLAHKIQGGSDWDYDYMPRDGCGYLPYVDQAHKLGNMNSVGSKVKYVCDEMEDKNDVIQCLSDYTWSMTSLSCDIDDECINIQTWESCYKITTISSYWEGVKSDCELINGHLADITDDNEMQHVIDHLKSQGAWFGMTKVFIGLNNRKNTSEYRRINGEIATYFYGNNSGFVSLSSPPQTTTTTATTTTTTTATTTNEDKKSTNVSPVAPTNSVMEDDGSGRRLKRCVTMTMANDLMWVKTDCGDHHTSLCEKEGGDCDQMTCYWFEEKKVSWLKAQENCKDHDAHLADITNEEEMQLVSRFLDSFKKLDTTASNIYIGINNRENITEYRTMNDTVVTYFNWLTETTTQPTTLYPPGRVNYEVHHGFIYTSTNNGSGDENDGSSDKNGGSASQPTLVTASTTSGVDPDQNGSLESGATQERCVAIDLENEYNWVTVDCNDILKGLCEIDATYSYL